MSQLIRHVFNALGVLCVTLSANAQLKPAYVAPRQYHCYQSPAPVKIDGKFDEKAWSQAAWSDDFTDIEGDKQPKPAMRTRLKMLWDNQYLYIAAEIEDQNIWATLHQHDTIIFLDNDFEVFIDPNGDTHHYFEIEINPHNTVMDLFMPKPYRDGGDALMNWDAHGMRTAVQIDGTLNKAGDKDKKWTVEMAIPFSALSFFNQKATPPKENSFWRINFSRVEWDTDIINGKYVKRRDKVTGKSLPEHNWVWSPQGIIDMHAPEKWGYVFFVKQPSGSPAIALPLPAMEQAKEYLWQIYRKQRDYKRDHSKYATTLAALGLSEGPVKENGLTYSLQLEALSDQYTATIRTENSTESCSINQEGKISQKH